MEDVEIEGVVGNVVVEVVGVIVTVVGGGRRDEGGCAVVMSRWPSTRGCRRGGT